MNNQQYIQKVENVHSYTSRINKNIDIELSNSIFLASYRNDIFLEYGHILI